MMPELYCASSCGPLAEPVWIHSVKPSSSAFTHHSALTGSAEILSQHRGIDARTDFARSGIGIAQDQKRRDGNVLRRTERIIRLNARAVAVERNAGGGDNDVTERHIRLTNSALGRCAVRCRIRRNRIAVSCLNAVMQHAAADFASGCCLLERLPLKPAPALMPM